MQDYNAEDGTGSTDHPQDLPPAGVPGQLTWPRLPERVHHQPAVAEAFVWQPLPPWRVVLPLTGPDAPVSGPAPFPAALARWVHWVGDDGLVALVDGQPRPELPPATDALQPDPGLAFLIAYAVRGQSALRHVEGPWALVLWEATQGQWLLATDRLGRCPVFWRCQDGQLEVASHRFAADVTAVPAGTHVRISAGAAPVFHGSWRLERRDRRGWEQVVAEAGERLNSVCRTLETWPERLLLADDLAGAALLLTALRACALLPQEMIWVEGMGTASLAEWRLLARHFAVPLREAGAAGLRDALRASGHGRPPAADGWAPAALVSCRGPAVLLAPLAPGLLPRCLRWRPWQSDLPARPALYGAQLVRAFGDDWQPALLAAVGDDAAAPRFQLVWPWLDEVVAHHLANLPPARRSGTPWRPDFRTALLRYVLPRALRRALGGPLGLV